MSKFKIEKAKRIDRVYASVIGWQKVCTSSTKATLINSVRDPRTYYSITSKPSIITMLSLTTSNWNLYAVLK